MDYILRLLKMNRVPDVEDPLLRDLINQWVHYKNLTVTAESRLRNIESRIERYIGKQD